MTSLGGNVFADIPAALLSERFDLLLQLKTCRLERIISIGHATPPGEWYDQDGDEWVVLLQGQAGLRFADEDGERTLAPGDYLWIPAQRRHRVEWTSRQPPAIWLALHLDKSAHNP
ncbi:MAG: cupin domain-containing protein [Candidatus Competibacteraceae bacterium]|nr:cupin domain-containing protein [Candidatus Competibacteraceae bacterium]